MWILANFMSLVGWALTVETILAVLERTCSTSFRSPARLRSVNIDVSDVVLGRVVIFPFHIDQALLVVVLSSEVHTVLTVNGNAASFGDVADDFITWNWITTLSNPNQESRSTFG